MWIVSLTFFTFIVIVKSITSNPTSYKCVKSPINSNECYKDSVSVNFESPTYHVGDINGQDGWMKTGTYDVEVTLQTTYPTFGNQSLRYSDGVATGSFGDQTFAKPLNDSVGEKTATASTFTVGTKYSNFEMQFDIASTKPTVEQPGLHLSVSPDRGDGSRMSYLRIEDSSKGIVVIFDDIQGILPAGDPECTPTGACANFVEKIIATLDRKVSHKIGLTMETPDGPSNDIVKVYIDGKLVHQGTSWEDFYRYDVEQAFEPTPRIVKTVLFRASSPATPADLNSGFLIDNLVIGAY